MKDIDFIKYEGMLGFHNVAIATYWTTAYEIYKQKSNFNHLFYLTQDNEALFNPMSSTYVMAENSYRLGFHHICSGPWMHNFITKNFSKDSDYFEFPVDKNIYNTNVERTKENKNIIFFAKPEMPRRCYELGIQALNEFHKIKPEIEIILFGSKFLDESKIPFKCTIKKILPNLTDLADLYRNADFGLIFSTTNPSLVPYEMLACGCPVGDLDLPGALYKYGNSHDNVFLLNPLPEKMASELSKIFDDIDLMHKKAASGKIYVDTEFPSEKEMGEIFKKIMIDGIKKDYAK